MSSSPQPVKSRIQSWLSEAQREFDDAGIVDLEPALRHPLYESSVEHFRSWIAAGEHASMHYLERGLERRTDPRNVFSATQSVLVVIRRYSARPWGDGKSGPKIARYARGTDYHDSLKDELEALCASLKRDLPRLTYKVCVDTSAVLERTWGAFAGLGWIGKNGLLIHPRIGSFFLIGVSLLSEPSGQEPQLLPDRCGACEKCLKGCPTQAITGRAWVQSLRCISYQTLEHRGENPQWPSTEWVAGCDVCQEVCPFNHKSARGAGDPELTHWADFARPEALASQFKASALSRVGEAGWRRNLERLPFSRNYDKKSE